MEFVDGVTLTDVLRERSPLGLQEAREIASQFLAGLEAIHAAGLVHRDVKPENVMLTRAGRVVVMDFGIARALAEAQAGTVSGHARVHGARAGAGRAGGRPGRRLLGGRRPGRDGGARRRPGPRQARRERLARRASRAAAASADTPWAAVLRKAVAQAGRRAVSDGRRPRARARGGHAADRRGRSPAAVSRPRVVHRSGRRVLRRPRARDRGDVEEAAPAAPAGPDRPLRRGQDLVPAGGARPERARRVAGRSSRRPRDRPFAALAHALAPELSGDAEAVARFLDFEQPDVAVDLAARWRRRHDHALVVLDQFEELFTQSPPAVQERFAGVLARLALEADVHVLLSMRDDFLFHCHRFESLTPVFSALTPIGPPTGAALRRALVQPALQVRLPLRGRDDRRGDAGAGGGRARRAAARRLHPGAAVGPARSRARAC